MQNYTKYTLYSIAAAAILNAPCIHFCVMFYPVFCLFFHSLASLRLYIYESANICAIALMKILLTVPTVYPALVLQLCTLLSTLED